MKTERFQSGNQRSSGRLEFDLAALRARVDGRPVALSGLQLRVLAHLCRHPGHVFSREELLADVWDESPRGHRTKAVDVVMCRLRRRLGGAGAMIESVRSTGYRLRAKPLDSPGEE